MPEIKFPNYLVSKSFGKNYISTTRPPFIVMVVDTEGPHKMLKNDGALQLLSHDDSSEIEISQAITKLIAWYENKYLKA